MIRTRYYLLFWMNFVADLLWLFRSFYLRRSSVESFVERDGFFLFGVGKMNGTVITNRLQNSFKIKDNNVYGSSYYWNFRTSSFKQVACLILVFFDHMMFVCRFQASRWSKPQEKSCYVASEFIVLSLLVGIC
jgi:hypothetical protein